MSFEAGQLLHNNPVGAALPAYACALVDAIRSEIARVYWNVNQKPWGFAGSSFDVGEEWHWNTPDLPQDGTGIPGIAWRAYYNWGGSPDDADWDQSKASLPNFAFDGVEIRWYKRYGRSMNANVQWGPVEWVAWFERCMDALDVFENRRECYPREEAIDNGRAARRCPKCDRYYVQSHDRGRCGWDGTKLVAVELTAEDRAVIKRKRDEWRAARKHGLPDDYEILESVEMERGWKVVLALRDSSLLGLFGGSKPPRKEHAALVLLPCGCHRSSFSSREADCRAQMQAWVEYWKGRVSDMRKAERGHDAGPF